MTGLLLYDLIFDISWLFSPQVHYIVLFVMAALRAVVVLAVSSLTFPNLAKLPCSLNIPSNCYEEKTSDSPWACHVHNLFFSQNLDDPKMLVSFLLSIFFNKAQSKAFPKPFFVKSLYFYFSLEIYIRYSCFPLSTGFA